MKQSSKMTLIATSTKLNFPIFESTHQFSFIAKTEICIMNLNNTALNRTKNWQLLQSITNSGK